MTPRAVPLTAAFCALTDGANPATTTSAANAAVPINGRFTASSFRTRTDSTLGQVVPSPISPGSQLSLTGPNRDDSFALTT